MQYEQAEQTVRKMGRDLADSIQQLEALDIDYFQEGYTQYSDYTFIIQDIEDLAEQCSPEHLPETVDELVYQYWDSFYHRIYERIEKTDHNAK